MNPEIILELLDELAPLKYFPAAGAARISIARLIGSMAGDMGQVERLIRRMTDGSVFNEWPGPGEVRALYCSMYKPKDGIEAVSAIYLDGFPSDRPRAPRIEAPERRRLAPGEPASADPELAKTVERMAAMRRAPPATKDEIDEIKRLQRERAREDTTREILNETEKEDED